MAQSYSYPTSSSVTIGAEGNNGSPIPGQSLLVAGKNPSNNLTPLSLDASGNLNVNIAAGTLNPIPTSDAADGPVTPGTAASKSILLGIQFNTSLPTLTSGQQAALQGDSNGRLILSPLTNASVVKAQLQDNAGNALSSTAGALNTLIPDTTVSGSITSTQTVTLAVNGLATAGIQVTGTWTGTLAVEGTVDGVNYNSTTAGFLANGQLVSNITSNAVYQANLSGLVSFRIRGNTINSGTAVVTIRGNATAAMVMLDNSLPAGSATIGAVTQASGPWTINLTQYGGTPTTLGQKTMAASIPMVLASDQSTINVTVATALPAGSNTIGAVTQSGNWSTRTQDGSGTAITSSTQGSKVGLNTSDIGYSSANAPVNNVYSSTNITTAAYVQLVASLTNDCQEIEIFDSSGQALYLATGGSGSEVNQIIITPGGNGRVKLRIAAGTRISAKAITATANSGSLYINFYG